MVRSEGRHILKSATGAQFGTSRVMSPDEIHRFVAHFERITRHMHAEMSKRAHMVIQLDANRSVTSIASDSTFHGD
jgi:D-glycerate 3-kinase